MAGSGNRGRRVNVRVAVDASTIIRSAPFVHNASGLCPSRLQRNPQVSNLCALLEMRISKNFGSNLPEGDPLAVLLAAVDKIGWIEGLSRSLLAISTGQVQDEGYDP